MLRGSSRVDTNGQYSSDGKRVAFASNRSGSVEIWTADASGGNPVQLTSFGKSITGTPRWSPDGQWIAFDSSSSGQFDVYIVRGEGSHPIRLTDNPAEDNIPSWSADGRFVYFHSTRGGGSDIWRIPPSGGDAVRITRNGGWVAFERGEGNWLYYVKQDGPTALWRMPVAGGPEQRVIERIPGRNFIPAEHGIYYLVEEAARLTALRLFDFAGERSREITRLTKPPGLGLSVSSDEKWVMWSQIDQSGSNIMLAGNVP
jgi:dipeptidyl aminopeptidase/acylaminoacyl peptidase